MQEQSLTMPKPMRTLIEATVGKSCRSIARILAYSPGRSNAEVADILTQISDEDRNVAGVIAHPQRAKNL